VRPPLRPIVLTPALIEKFWSRVNRDGPTMPRMDTPCWVWTGERSAGYGRIMIDPLPVGAHRFAWTLANGPIPDGLFILHACDNPPCVNPAHLRPGTDRENVGDMIARGRRYQPPSAGILNSRAKLTPNEVREIRAIGNSEPRTHLAARYGVCPKTIRQILRREIWQSV